VDDRENLKKELVKVVGEKTKINEELEVTHQTILQMQKELEVARQELTDEEGAWGGPPGKHRLAKCPNLSATLST
jgi:predicted  nucleic acid-binding Zn-ribbon protein